mmetsp:Transcript_37113/g.104757  ORF Transcript_37113/g.104757 Transcript_37113/m.104757 type:complete len:326 (-) Transcript_37113:1713-2690(-)
MCHLLVRNSVGSAERPDVDAAGWGLPEVSKVILRDLACGNGEEAEDAATTVVHQHHCQRWLPLASSQEVEAIGVVHKGDVAYKEGGGAAEAIRKASGGAQHAIDAAGTTVGGHRNSKAGRAAGHGTAAIPLEARISVHIADRHRVAEEEGVAAGQLGRHLASDQRFGHLPSGHRRLEGPLDLLLRHAVQQGVELPPAAHPDQGLRELLSSILGELGQRSPHPHGQRAPRVQRARVWSRQGPLGASLQGCPFQEGHQALAGQVPTHLQDDVGLQSRPHRASIGNVFLGGQQLVHVVHNKRVGEVGVQAAAHGRGGQTAAAPHPQAA